MPMPQFYGGETPTEVYQQFIACIPEIVALKLKSFDPNWLSRPAIPTLAFLTKDMERMPTDMRNDVIRQYHNALAQVKIACTPITDRKAFRFSWYLHKEG